MIVKKPIGSVKINGIISRLSVGNPVPQNILDYWTENKQLEKLKKAGIIGKAEKDGSADNDTPEGPGDLDDDALFEDEK